MVVVCSKGVGHREGGVVWECRGGQGRVVCTGIPGDSRIRHPSTRTTRAGDQRTHATQGTKDGVTKVKGHGSQEKEGARSKEGSIQDDHDHPPKTTTTMQHPIAGGRGGVK